MIALSLVLAPPPVSAQSSRPAAETTRSSRPVWPWAIIGVGGVMLVGAAVTGGLTLARQSEVDLVCTAHSCPPSAEASQAEGRALAFTTDALWVGGLVVGMLGLVLLFALPSDLETIPAVACGPDGCFAGLGGVF